MAKSTKTISPPAIEVINQIYSIRGQKVMLDFDLAMLYNVETRALKQAVRRNKDRFPADFMFALSKVEIDNLVSQNLIPNKSRLGGAVPFAFTEQGVSMLSSVLKSKEALHVNISIMRAFVQMRQLLENNKELKKQLSELENKYDEQFKVVFDAIRNLIHQKTKPRERIGFKKDFL
ncbi:MAG TPA: ORF6N domain-containing protein [Segetibacter sp.]